MRRATCAAVIAGAALAAGWSIPAAAQTASWQVEAGVGGDSLSNGAPGWSQVDFSLRKRFAPRSQFEFSVRRTRRSGLADDEVGALVSLPLDAHWSGTLAATLSPSHHALARGTGRVELARVLEGGWVVSAALGRRLYDAQPGVGAGNSHAAIGVERYLGAWRLAAALGRTRLDGGGETSGSTRLQVDRSFDGERGRVGVILARGRELEGITGTATAPPDVIDQRVDTLALVGVWPLAPAWSLAWEASHVRNDDLRRRSGAAAGAPYQRSGVRISVRHDF